MSKCKRCGGSGVAWRLWQKGQQIPRGYGKSLFIPCPGCEAGKKIPVVREININKEDA